MTLFIGVYYSNIWHNILLQYPVQYLQRRMAQLFLLTRDHNCFPCRLLVTAFLVSQANLSGSVQTICATILVSPGHTIKSVKDSLSSYMHSNHLQQLSCQSVSSLFMACNSLGKCYFQSVLCRTQGIMVLQTLMSEQWKCLLSPSVDLWDVAWCLLCNL
jgi:hypothetical protein